jgi:hypothetical protein
MNFGFLLKSAGCLFILCACHLAGGIVTFVFRDEFDAGLLREMRTLMVEYQSRGYDWVRLQDDVIKQRTHAFN